MKSKDRKTIFSLPLIVILGLGLVLVGIFYLMRQLGDGNPPQAVVGNEAVTVTTSATSIWKAFQESSPFAYTTPLPDPVQSPLDGLYAMIDQSQPQWWKCVRCADYRPVGGIWKLKFDKGVMRIFYEVTGWRSIASYTVSEDRLYIFNDPYCPEDLGEYKWQVDGGQLKLEAIADACAFDLRAENLSRESWSACTSSGETVDLGTTKQASSACEENLVIPTSAAQPELTVKVTVYGGDSRFFVKPPDVIANANTADREAPAGINISYDDNTIPYGVHRVLWWNGDWVEATTELPFTAIGVQFFGELQIGWARVLFDGVEVWRGNTSAIWSKNARTGGYIEISGFSPGKHTIRAESLGFDYRPVTVVSFGYSYESGVETANP